MTGFATARTAFFALSLFFTTSCASSNKSVNPPHAVQNAGYVDFYAEPPAQLSWAIECFDDRAKKFKKVFSSYPPVEDNVLRLALPPGTHHLQISYYNRIIADPIEIEVPVRGGYVTPVRITFSKASSTAIESRTVSVGGTAYGRYGRRTRIQSTQVDAFSANAAAADPIPYKQKHAMLYARKP